MRNLLFLNVLLFLVCYSAVNTSYSQSAGTIPDILTLDRANEIFLERNLAIEAARLQVTRAEADRIAARLRPRPSMNISAENLRAAGPSPFNRIYEAGTVVTQPFELGGQRKARRELAEKSISVAEAQLTNAIRQRQFEMRRSYFDALLAQMLLELEINNQTDFSELVRYNAVRLSEGEISPAEELRVRLEKVRYDSSVGNARLALRQAKIRLLEVLGETDFSRVEQLELRDRFDFQHYAIDLSMLRSDALMNRPEIKLAEAELSRSESSLKYERSRASGQIEPYVGYRRVGPDNTVLAGVSIPLPFGNRNQSEIARAEAEERIARNGLLQARNRTNAEVEGAFLAYETAREQANAFETGILQQADQSRDIFLLSYREGATDLVNLLDTQRTRNEVRSAYYRSLLAYYVSIFQLEFVTGTDIRK